MRELPVVILAAGEGRRLSLGCGVPKPLTKFAGISLLERAIRTWKRQGFSDFYVVVGYGKEEVAGVARKIGRQLGVKVRVVENGEWPKGNGTSVLALSGVIKTPFFLQMVDHVFDETVISAFLRKVDSFEKSLVAADPRVEQVLDLPDATKIKLSDGNIVDIGKQLKDFDVVDMGLFFCTPEIFDSLRKSCDNGGGELAEGIRWLARQGRIKAVRVEVGEWFDIDRPEILKVAERRLFEKMRNSKDGVISRYLNRKISFPVSKRLSSRFSPNTMTAVSFLVVFAGVGLFALRSPLATGLAGVLIQLSSILDGCDGEIARIRLESTPHGAWLDTVLDRYADALIVAAVTYNFWPVGTGVWVWMGGVFSLLAFLGVSYVKKEYLLRTGKEVRSTVFEKLTKRDTRLFVIFCGALLGVPYWAMMAIALYTHLWMISFILAEVKGRNLRKMG